MNDNKIEIERSGSVKPKPTAGEILQKTLRISLIVLIVIFALVMVLNLITSGGALFSDSKYIITLN